jgi:hypothetical protein
MNTENKEKATADLLGQLDYIRDQKRKRIAAVQSEITSLRYQLESAEKEFEYLRTQDDLLAAIIERGL